MLTINGRRLAGVGAVVLMLAGFAAAFASVTGCKSASRDARSNRYTIRATLDPAHRFIRADVLLRVRVPSQGTDRLTFFLHHRLKVSSVTGPEVDGFEVSRNPQGTVPFMPEAGTVVVKLAHRAPGGGIASVRFRYEGTVSHLPNGAPNVVSPDWTEIGLYYPWYPCNPAYGDLTYDLMVNADPAYQLRSYDGFTREGEAWHFRCDRPTTDIVLTAARTMRSVEVSGSEARVWVHYSRVRRTTALKLGKDMEWLLHLYRGWFGGTNAPRITVIESQRTRGGGYTRPGLVVLAGLDDRRFASDQDHYVRYLGHEAAHLWWYRAPAASWEDWLNESFAEYSALLAVRRRFGVDAFHARLAEKAARIDGLPPIWGLDRSGFENAGTVQAVLYDKGPVLLYTLDKMIGRGQFLDLCRAMVARRVGNTQAFLATLEQLQGKEVRTRFEEMLKE